VPHAANLNQTSTCDQSSPLFAPSIRVLTAGFSFGELNRMKSIEEFLSNLERRPGSPAPRFTTNRHPNHPSLPDAVRQAANRGWQGFPVSLVARATARPDLLIGEATRDISRLEELAAEYPGCDWRVALGPSSLCILELDGPEGRDTFAALSQEQGDCLTLQARRGDIAWAYFRWPDGLVLRDGARELMTGLRILGPGDSCIFPPFGGSLYVNPWAEIEAVPYWLRELAFESPDSPPANTVRVPAPSPRPAPCRSRKVFDRPGGSARTGHPVHGQAGWRRGFRISRRR
jgi:hypothetical protein